MRLNPLAISLALISVSTPTTQAAIFSSVGPTIQFDNASSYAGTLFASDNAALHPGQSFQLIITNNSVPSSVPFDGVLSSLPPYSVTFTSLNVNGILYDVTLEDAGASFKVTRKK